MFLKIKAFRPATLLKETAAQMFSCEICAFFKNNYFEKHLRTTASKHSKQIKNKIYETHTKFIRLFYK